MYRRGYRPLTVQRQQNAERYESAGCQADKYRKNIDPTYVDQDGRNAVHLSVLLAVREHAGSTDKTPAAAGENGAGEPVADSPAIVALDQAVKAGCDANAVDRWGRRPIHYAAEAGHIACLRRLLRHGVDPNALTSAASSTINDAGLQQLQQQQPHPTKSGSASSAGLTPLMVAAESGRVEAMRVLLKNGAKASLTNEKSETALHYAAAACVCPADCIAVLVAQLPVTVGCASLVNHQTSDGSTALMVAARNRRSSSAAVGALLRLGADVQAVDAEGRTALHWAAEANEPDVVQLLHAAAANLDAVDAQGNTAYVTAIKANSAEALQQLITAGCDGSMIDGLMGTAVALAAVKGHGRVIETLVKNGEDPDDFGYFGKTPLMLAAYEANVDAVETLLRLGADCDLGARTGGTALAAALLRTNSNNEANRHHIVIQLIRAGADVNHRSAMGAPTAPSPHGVGLATHSFKAVCGPQTGRNWPLSYAIDTGYISLVRILLLAGSEVPSDEIRQRQLQIGPRFFDADELLAPVVEWTSQPPTLQHVCRAVVRRAVLAGRYRAETPPAEFHMSDVVRSLPVADRLRRYLDFEELDSISVQRARVLDGAGAGMMSLAAGQPCGARAIESVGMRPSPGGGGDGGGGGGGGGGGIQHVLQPSSQSPVISVREC